MAEKKIAITIGGGSCPGISPLVYFLHKEVTAQGLTPFYFGGWDSLLENKPEKIEPDFRYIERSGSPVGTSRFNPKDEEIKDIEKSLEGYEGIIGIGGNDTLSVLARIKGYNKTRIGIPKTLDNDLGGTDFTLGHWSVVDNLVQAITSARSSTVDHNRFVVVETIGQDVGWVAFRAGKFTGADFVIIPEVKVNLKQVLEGVKGNPKGLVVMPASAEIEGLQTKEAGMTHADGFKNLRYEDRDIGKALAQEIKAVHGFDARSINLSDSIRGGRACAYDLFLASLFAKEAGKGLKNKETEPCMVAVKDNKPAHSDPGEASKKRQFVPKDEYDYLP